MYKRIFLVSFILLISSTGIQAQTTMHTWYVADAKIACNITPEVVTSCYKIKDSLSGDWRNFPYEIEGFEHEKGFEYVIDVIEEKLQYPEPNGPPSKWTLSRMVSKQTTVFTDKRLLVNNTFRLINFEQYGKTTLAVKAKPFIKFGIDTNAIYGFAGCNSFSGPCSYATAFMEFGPLMTTKMTCQFQDIEDKLMQSLKGRATFYIRKGMLYIVCENFITLHLKPERSLDSMFKVIEAENVPKNDINYFKTEEGVYTVNAPAPDDKVNIIYNYRAVKLTPEEKKKISLKLLPIGNAMPVIHILILNKEHEKPHYAYAIIVYKDGTKKQVEIRDAN